MGLMRVSPGPGRDGRHLAVGGGRGGGGLEVSPLGHGAAGGLGGLGALERP